MANFQKPTGLTPEYASQFRDAAIVRAYKHREPYAAEVFGILRGLCAGSRPRVLDLGCGTGDLTFGLAEFADSVDAVDFSAEMLAEAKRRAADREGMEAIRWIEAAVEDAEVNGPYDLVTSAQSFHWMNWDLVAARLKGWLKPGAHFALVTRGYADRAWWTPDFQAIIDRYTTNKEYQAYDLVEETRRSGLFTLVGDRRTAIQPFAQTVTELVESFHSRNGFSRDRMSLKAAEAFDLEAAAYLGAYTDGSVLKLGACSRVSWFTVN